MNRIQEANRLLAENLVESIIKDYDACGVAAAIIDKNGVTQYEKFWGSKELGTGEKPDGETIFGLASVQNPLLLWQLCRWRSGES